MGMYTELNICVNLVKNTPDDIIDILKYMLGEESDEKINIPGHQFFRTDRWRMLFTCGSYYFDGLTNSHMEHDHIDEMYHLNVRSSLKNYDREIEKFLDFIDPYLDTYGFIGYMRYEEDDDPTLIYSTEKGIEYKVVE